MAAGYTFSNGCVIGMSWHILVSSQRVPPGLVNKVEFFGLIPQVVRTNDIERSVTVMYHFPYDTKFLLKYLYLF